MGNLETSKGPTTTVLGRQRRSASRETFTVMVEPLLALPECSQLGRKTAPCDARTTPSDGSEDVTAGSLL